MPILITHRPIFRRLFKGQLSVEFVSHAPAWRLYCWHNPTWTKVCVGSRRHHLGYRSAYACQRVRHRIAQESRKRNLERLQRDGIKIKDLGGGFSIHLGH